MDQELTHYIQLPLKQHEIKTAATHQIYNVGVTVGHQSPLRDVENDIFEFIIQLGKIGSTETCSQAIYLIIQCI
jgi:hypothetical protein